jgi:hypothetical protein
MDITRTKIRGDTLGKSNIPVVDDQKKLTANQNIKLMRNDKLFTNKSIHLK